MHGCHLWYWWLSVRARLMINVWIVPSLRYWHVLINFNVSRERMFRLVIHGHCLQLHFQLIRINYVFRLAVMHCY